MRALGRIGGTTFRTDSFRIVVPSDSDSCSAHLTNHGVTVVGNSATVEFDAVGGKKSFHCKEMGRQDKPETCAFYLIA